MSEDQSQKNFFMKALDNENNDGIQKYNTSLIKQIKNDYLQKLLLPRDKLKDFHLKLKDYRYVDDLTDIQYGRYIRWINLNDPNNIKLTTGGIIIDIKILASGIHVVCKNNKNHRFQIKIDECFIFQKLTDQEKIILYALDHVSS
jgi:hypothetical protein|uniref:Uncharacterized protein n=1 Tax=viral metagenome TaxID=1070528 RepID=A0A6C0CZX6_9ZZZZ